MSPIVRSAGAHFLVKTGHDDAPVRGEVAYQGDVVDEDRLADGELERLRTLGVFEEPPGPSQGPHSPTAEEAEQFSGITDPRAGAPRVEESEDVDELTDDELAEWMRTRPAVSTVVRVSGDDPSRARRLLAAEEQATEGNSRRSLVRDLSRLTGGEGEDLGV
jgi:hypothetical protein